MHKNSQLKRSVFRILLILMGISMLLGISVAFPSQAKANFIHDGSFEYPQAVQPVTLAGVPGDRSATLTWVDPNESENLLGYKIIYGTKPCLEFFPPNYEASLELGLINSKKVEGLTNGVQYFFKIARIETDSLTGESKTISLVPVDNISPVTVILTDPSLPQGLAGFFTVTPKVSFKVSELAKTFYQWNSTSEMGWQTAEELTVPDGENILYYFSIDLAGNVEPVKWQIFHVDTLLPFPPNLSIAINSDKESVTLSWGITEDAAFYEIWQILPEKKLVAKVPFSQLSYLVNGLKTNIYYQYQVVVYDQAGNNASSNLVNAEMPQIVLLTVSSPSNSKKVVKTVKPAIGEGVSTVAETPKAIEGVQNQKEPDQNTNQGSWNKLLIGLSILIIAAGIATGGYYGYEWMDSRRDSKHRDSRW